MCRVDGAHCASYTESDVVNKASATLTVDSRESGPWSGTITMTNSSSGDYVGCVFIDRDGESMVDGLMVAATKATVKFTEGDYIRVMPGQPFRVEDLYISLVEDRNFGLPATVFEIYPEDS